MEVFLVVDEASFIEHNNSELSPRWRGCLRNIFIAQEVCFGCFHFLAVISSAAVAFVYKFLRWVSTEEGHAGILGELRCLLCQAAIS